MADLLLRVALLLTAVGCVLLGAPALLTAPVVAAAAVTVVQRRAGRRALGGLDATLVGVGGLLVALVLVGFALNLVGVPLARTGWALSLGGLGLAALLLPGSGPRHPGQNDGERSGLVGSEPGRLVRPADAPWLALCALVLVAGIGLSVRSVDATDVAPLALSVAAMDGVVATVEVSSGTATGPLELRADTGNGFVSYPLFRLPAGGARRTEVLVQAGGRTVVTINNPGQAEPLRSLVVDP